jgi:transposase-like protein
MPVEKSKKHKRVVYAGRLRLRLVPGRGARELTEFVQDNVAQGAVVRTDGWRGYDDLAKLGYTHEPLVLDGDPERTDAHLPMTHMAFSNLKTWLVGRHHGVSQQHLQAYLNEFVLRFNQPALLPHDRVQLCSGPRGACFGTHLRDTLQR